MRRHGRAAIRIASRAEDEVAVAMWSARVHREARVGARVVASISGKVLRVDGVAPGGYGVCVTETMLGVRPDILARVGPRWVEKDLHDLGGAPSSAGVHEAEARPSSAAPSPRAGVS